MDIEGLSLAELESQVDTKSEDFLRAIQYYGGEANTTEIRKRSGLSKNEVSYRYKKLEGLGLINYHQSETGYGERVPPKVATFTDECKRLIKEGLLSEEEHTETQRDVFDVSKADFLALEEKVSELENRIDVLTQNGGS